MNPLYHRCHFLLSTLNFNRDVPDEGYEIAFAGRSNAGKSSAINAITNRKSLARTSKTPGRTQQLVFFEVDPQRRLV
ncbi:MAG TPA: YihA family ribosome biogenesis GTP-binding protein, partial [Methylothermaceae bacterium]|nr:YihA family ribosome biogenesis GTP-binding protein [Methylothermaceae bacterium]